MEKLDNNFSKIKGKMKTLILTLSLALGVNFAYPQTKVGANSNRMEQSSESQERNIETFFKIIENRNLRISNTSEKTIDVYVKRMNAELENELHNTEVIKKMNNLVNILNTKYSKNISRDNYLLTLQSAFKILSNTEKYRGLNQFSDKFSSTFDINFENALQFVQYVNGLSHNGSLKTQKKVGTSVLQCIFEDLNNQTIYQYDGKNNLVNNEKPQTKIKQTDNQISTTNDNDLNNINLLSNSLSLNKLNGINYEDVLHMVNSIKHEGLRNAVMASLLNNDVIGAQRLLGMDINCDKNKYPDFVASSRLGQRELRLMEKHGQYMTLRDSQEVLNYFESIEQDYKESDATFQKYEPLSVYKKFLEGKGRFNNHGLPYCIVSKYDYTLYLFSADHKLILETPVLTGAHVGNKPNVPNKVKTTPGGFYHIGLFCDKTTSGGNLFSLYHSDFIVTLPDDGQYELKTDANGNYIYVLGIHGEGILRGYKVVIGANGKRTLVEVPRSELYDLYEPGCRNTSLGCTNVQVQRFGILRNYLKIGSKYYVCFDDEINNNDLGCTQGNSIEVIEHFGYSPDNTIDRDIAQLDDDSIESKELISKNNLVHNSIKELV